MYNKYTFIYVMWKTKTKTIVENIPNIFLYIYKILNQDAFKIDNIISFWIGKGGILKKKTYFKVCSTEI